MNRFINLIGLLTLCVFLNLSFAQESLDRGMVAVQRADGSVFVSWRSLESDGEDQAFKVMKLKSSFMSGGPRMPLKNDGKTTCVVDTDVKTGDEPHYLLFKADAPSKVIGSAGIKVSKNPKPYISIPLQGDYDFQKVGVGDLNGDGSLEFVIKQPNFNTDPYQQPGYWKPSPTTYKIEAYNLNGEMLWRYDMGWSIEAGMWYSPFVVYDLDGDGKAEVYCKAGEGDPRDEKGLVKDGPEYLVKLDGETGKVVKKIDWLTRDGYVDYNRSCRNFLTIAYLDGVKPSLIMQRGTYKLIRTQALDKNLKQEWLWQATEDMPKYRGSGSHGLISADIDNDGKDELVIGSSAIDDNGKELWTLGMGHPDVCYVADIDPKNPGLEIYYGFETRQDTDGVCLVDAKSGKKLWAHKKPTKHIHNQGMIGDVLAEHPGIETFSGERDSDDRWFYSASGELIDVEQGGTLSPRPLWWDDDPQKEVIKKRSIQDWGSDDSLQDIEGRLIAVMDCLGDHREEVITALKGELRIYTTTISTNEVKPCLLQNRQYRVGVAAQTTGYYYPAQLGIE
ncbi:MAG: hypothetical protein P9L94_15980 [Candidatus Hinthialibacter antarcticus]|nr:hypothetical protein [Candidatus Hinthialibacter antarcticus]